MSVDSGPAPPETQGGGGGKLLRPSSSDDGKETVGSEMEYALIK